MKTYLVGGAVRDTLLGRPVHERDWVVVGATPADLEARGFRLVGRDFPVFLHPQTHEEYALARVERKTGPGYRGFVTEFSPDVTLEQDLSRRDLTVNAIARDPDDGALIDPYAGRRDLEARILRHVSPAFVEDPLRVLRVARFAAQLGPFGFQVAAETLELMRQIGASGELAALVPERVWQELLKALASPSPRRFVEVLRDADALRRILPELAALEGVPQPVDWHPEIDTYVHLLLTLDAATGLSPDPVVRFATLVHDLGKGTTPPEQWPGHRGHEARGVPLLEDLCNRLRVPTEYRDIARLVMRYHGLAHRALDLAPPEMLALLEALDAFRRPQRLEQFLLACEADLRGRAGFAERPYPQAGCLRRALAAARAASSDPALFQAGTQGSPGPDIAQRVRDARVAAIAAVGAESP